MVWHSIPISAPAVVMRARAAPRAPAAQPEPAEAVVEMARLGWMEVRRAEREETYRETPGGAVRLVLAARLLPVVRPAATVACLAVTVALEARQAQETRGAFPARAAAPAVERRAALAAQARVAMEAAVPHRPELAAAPPVAPVRSKDVGGRAASAHC